MILECKCRAEVESNGVGGSELRASRPAEECSMSSFQSRHL